MADDICQRIHRISPVEAATDPVESFDCIVGDSVQRDVFKHFAAGTGDFAKVFVPVAFWLRFLEMAGLDENCSPSQLAGMPSYVEWWTRRSGRLARTSSFTQSRTDSGGLYV